MSVLDWVLVAAVLGMALAGFWKGAVRIVFGIGGLAAGLWLAVVAGGEVAVLLSGTVRPDWLAAALAVAVVVLACCAVGAAAGWGVERTLEALRLGWVNRTAGAALSGAAGLLVTGVLLVVAARTSPAVAGLCERSLLAPHLLRALDWLV